MLSTGDTLEQDDSVLPFFVPLPVQTTTETLRLVNPTTPGNFRWEAGVRSRDISGWQLALHKKSVWNPTPCAKKRGVRASPRFQTPFLCKAMAVRNSLGSALKIVNDATLGSKVWAPSCAR
jgi:hypothetical protein